MFRAICLSLFLLLSGCSAKYNIGYSINPLDSSHAKYKTPVIVRELADRRPTSERFEPSDINEFRFVSSDKSFAKPVADEITKALSLELANSGVEVAGPENFIPGQKPYLRVFGDVLHFYVSRQTIPVGSIKKNVSTLWQRERFTVKVSLNIEMIDTIQKKRIMERTYSSSDSIIVKTDMIDANNAENKDNWSSAGDQYCIQLLNDHLERVIIEARRDIVSLLAPKKTTPKNRVNPDLEMELEL